MMYATNSWTASVERRAAVDGARSQNLSNPSLDKVPPSEDTATKALWIYDLRTNQRCTLKERPMTRADLGDFVGCYRSGEVYARAESDRFRKFALDALMARDKLNLDIFWLKDDALDDPDLLPPPDEVAAEVVESLEAALASFRSVAAKAARSVTDGEP